MPSAGVQAVAYRIKLHMPDQSNSMKVIMASTQDSPEPTAFSSDQLGTPSWTSLRGCVSHEKTAIMRKAEFRAAQRSLTSRVGDMGALRSAGRHPAKQGLGVVPPLGPSVRG